jgi:uncharacterized protein
MTVLSRRDPRIAVLGYTLLLLAPSLALGAGLFPLDLRFHLLIAVSAFCIVPCLLTGWSLADLGLAARGDRRQWGTGLMTTGLLLFFVLAESRFSSSSRTPPDWLRFAPFYVLISSPLQEIVCRAIPKLIAERMGASGISYVLFSSLIFSLMHLAYGDGALLINTFLAGVVWSAAYLLTRNIWPIIASHATVGLFAFWLGLA